MKIILQLAVPALVKLSRREPEELQKRLMLYVPPLLVFKLVVPVLTFPCLARIVTKVFCDRASKKARVVELLGEPASTTTKPRFMLPELAPKV